MKIIVGSTNKAKVNAVKEVLESMGHQVIGVETQSCVSNQPFSDEETITGAYNRASSSSLIGDIGIGLEAGVQEQNGIYYLVNWGVLKTSDDHIFYAGGTRIPLPEELVLPLKSGKELSEVIDAYSSRIDVRSNEGAIGILTADFFGRKENFVHIIRLLWGQYLYQKNVKNYNL